MAACGILQISGGREDQRIPQEYFMGYQVAHVGLAPLFSGRQDDILENTYRHFAQLVFTARRNG